MRALADMRSSVFFTGLRDRLRPMHSNGPWDVLVCIITDMAFLVAKLWWELGFGVYSKLHTIDCPNICGAMGCGAQSRFSPALGFGGNLLP